MRTQVRALASGRHLPARTREGTRRDVHRASELQGHEDRKVHNKIEAKPRAIQRLVNCDGHLAEICASSEATGS